MTSFDGIDGKVGVLGRVEFRRNIVLDFHLIFIILIIPITFNIRIGIFIVVRKNSVMRSFYLILVIFLEIFLVWILLIYNRCLL